jgi:hypothetical protein
MVDVSQGIKSIHWNHQRVIAVRHNPARAIYETYNKNTMKNAATLQAVICSTFEEDNDEEERMGERQEEKSCFNCLYRRWTQAGFECAYKK